MVPQTLMGLYAEIWRRRDLVRHLVRSQQQASIHRTALGNLWFALVPLSQIAIFYFLVVVIFSSGASPAAAFLLICMGVMHYMVLNNVSSYVQPSIYNEASLLLQIKLEPVVLVAAGFLRTLKVSGFGIALFFVFFVVLGGPVSWRLLAYPLVLALWLALCWVIGLWLATAAVYLRDLERLSPILLQVVMYLSPVIYTFEMFPSAYRDFFLLNPVASAFALLQWCLLGHGVSPALPLAIVVAWVLVGGWFGHAFYRRARPGMTKVL
ncbi:hypothetical protein FN976_05120 [Caenimonas sedimenti]|uniref:Uncharacterized protein n=1 Tax=Caenimonas sedimenti TaxID=2596921 RepID=A0A562ZU20_9BURK|nr:ABC transporter permease [Caenimonas sedimenti]TWO72099.1 hypothetical protein FN976_05120 [Caenimonas sedimenti]